MTQLEALIEEARLQATDHPSKDARWFATSVHEYLTTQRTWVGLTDEETAKCFEAKVISDRLKADAKRIEAKLKEKNT
jgi:hypothetical protein